MTSSPLATQFSNGESAAPQERHRLLGLIVDAVEQAVVAIDRAGKVLFWNRCAEEMYGWQADEALGRSLNELLLPEASREQAVAIRARLRRGERWSGEFLVRRRDGTALPVHATDSPILDDRGRLVGMVGVATDVSGRKRLEAAVQRYESRQFLSARLKLEALWDWDLRSDVIWWNGGSSLGYAPQEVRHGLAWWAERVHPNDREILLNGLRAALENGAREHTAEHRFRRSDGSYAFVAARCHFERDADGCATRVVGVTMDLGGLDRSEKRLRLFAEQIPALAWATDRHLCVLWSLGAGFYAAEGLLVGKSIHDIPEVSAQSIEAHLKALQGQASRFEARFRDRIADLHVRPFRDETGSIVGAVGVALDVTDRKRAEEALQQAERQLLEAQQLAHIGRWEWDVASDALIWSDELYRVFGIEPGSVELTRDRILDLLHPDDRERESARVQAAFEGRAPYGEAEYRIRHPDGSERVIHTRGVVIRDEASRPVRVVGTTMDVTERKRTEDELAHRMQQQAAVARLGLTALRSADLQALFDEAVSLVMGTLGADACKLMERLPDGGLLLRAGAGWKEGTVGAYRVPPDAQSLCAHTLRCNAPMVVEDFGSETRFSVPAILAEGLVSAISVPVRTRDDSFGVLAAYARQRRSYAEDDLSFLQSIANVLATAIERERGAAELRDKGAQLQGLSHRLLEAQEAERRSIARELHDDFGQLLTAIRLNLQTDRDPAESIELVDDAVQRMRDLALDLRPTILDDLGLEAALRWYVQREAKRAGMGLRLDLRPLGTRLPPAVETACFRLVQEALTNAVRHAQALAFEVELAASAGEVRLTVSDDGKGFDVRAARRRANASGSQGLLIMEERIALAGGSLQICSAPGRGTSISARVRLPGAAT